MSRTVEDWHEEPSAHEQFVYAQRIAGTLLTLRWEEDERDHAPSYDSSFGADSCYCCACARGDGVW